MSHGSRTPAPRRRRPRLVTVALWVVAIGGAREWAFARNRRRYGSPIPTPSDPTR